MINSIPRVEGFTEVQRNNLLRLSFLCQATMDLTTSKVTAGASKLQVMRRRYPKRKSEGFLQRKSRTQTSAQMTVTKVELKVRQTQKQIR
jgi:hypothetical protein